MKKILSTICILWFLVYCSSAQDVSVLDWKSWRDETIWVQTILALWDSLTAWYWVDTYDNYTSKLSKLLSQNNYNYEIINAGISWDTSGDLLSRSSEYLENDPDIVLLVIWGNDGLQKKSTDEMKENILDIIDIYDI